MAINRGFRKERLPDPLTYYKREGLKLHGSGKWRSARCPFHKDRDPSLRIHVPSGGFNCHGCGAKGGDVLDFHQRRHGLKFAEAAKDLGAWEEPLPVPTVTPAKASSGQDRHETAKEAARRLATMFLGKDFVPEALHEYRDERGAPLYWVIRARNTNTGKKWIRPMLNVDGCFQLGKPEFENGTKPLYGLDLLARYPGKMVVVCEGEMCADVLRKRGLLAITSGGATSAEGADWTPLAGRQVIFWPDHDDPGQQYAKDVAKRLNEIGCRTEVIDAAQLGLDKGGDAVDWLKAHPEASKDEIVGLPRQGSPDAASIAPTIRASAPVPVHADLAIIARWCAERCVRDSRAWTSIEALYRDLCDWCGADYAFAPGEFVDLLTEMGVMAGTEFAQGLVLACDHDAVAVAEDGDSGR